MYKQEKENFVQAILESNPELVNYEFDPKDKINDYFECNLFATLVAKHPKIATQFAPYYNGENVSLKYPEYSILFRSILDGNEALAYMLAEKFNINKITLEEEYTNQPHSNEKLIDVVARINVELGKSKKKQILSFTNKASSTVSPTKGSKRKRNDIEKTQTPTFSR